MLYLGIFHPIHTHKTETYIRACVSFSRAISYGSDAIIFYCNFLHSVQL